MHAQNQGKNTTIMDELINLVKADNTILDCPKFGAGDTIIVEYMIKEGVKTRPQKFQGVVLQRKGSGATETFTIRKMSGEIGVERIFSLSNPNLTSITVIKHGKVRRAKIFYQRGLTGKKARITEKRM
ncbi:MAG: large subunit ribosomal protein L19 [Bacteroidia bacterium]